MPDTMLARFQAEMSEADLIAAAHKGLAANHEMDRILHEYARSRAPWPGSVEISYAAAAAAHADAVSVLSRFAATTLGGAQAKAALLATTVTDPFTLSLVADLLALANPPAAVGEPPTTT